MTAHMVRAALVAVALRGVAAPDGEGWADTFTDDGQFATMAGRPALLKFASDWHERGQSMKLRHWVTNIVVTPPAEGAAAKCRLAGLS